MTKKTTTRQAQPQPVDGPVTKDAKSPVITHFTPEERAAIGRTARAKTPRESHAAWDGAFRPARSHRASGGAGANPGG